MERSIIRELYGLIIIHNENDVGVKSLSERDEMLAVLGASRERNPDAIGHLHRLSTGRCLLLA